MYKKDAKVGIDETTKKWVFHNFENCKKKRDMGSIEVPVMFIFLGYQPEQKQTQVITHQNRE